MLCMVERFQFFTNSLEDAEISESLSTWIRKKDGRLPNAKQIHFRIKYLSLHQR